MKNQLLLILALFSFSFANAQDIPKALLHEDKSDPEAKKILDKVKKIYDGYQNIEVDFTLTIEIPEEPEEVQKGKMRQSKDQYFLDLPIMSIYCNGEYIWTHLKKNKQVQISDFEEIEDNDEIMSPTDLLNAYESGKYYYVLMNEAYEGKTAIQEIEFKPKDRDSEYSKMRVTIDKKKARIMRIKIFSKDSSRFTLEVNDLKPNQKFSTSTFMLDTKTLAKDIKIEDLRL